ncbi:MAG: pyridoxine 5'-phosphate synthase [candidate division WOR-3 bacterium]
MKKLLVNIDHIATLREARKESFPDPVQAATLVELGGGDGITVHLRTDRRHINERDLELLRKTIKTELNLEMAATNEMLDIALNVRPDIITLVPEKPEELTTEGGLDLKKHFKTIKPIAEKIVSADILLSVFIEADKAQVLAAKKLGASLIEINTNQYSEKSRIKNRDAEVQINAILDRIASIAQFAKGQGLIVHCGHGLDYWNIEPILKINEIEGFSIGFSIVARAVLVGLKEAVSQMKMIIYHKEQDIINRRVKC